MFVTELEKVHYRPQSSQAKFFSVQLKLKLEETGKKIRGTPVFGSIWIPDHLPGNIKNWIQEMESDLRSAGVTITTRLPVETFSISDLRFKSGDVDLIFVVIYNDYDFLRELQKNVSLMSLPVYILASDSDIEQLVKNDKTIDIGNQRVDFDEYLRKHNIYRISALKKTKFYSEIYALQTINFIKNSDKQSFHDDFFKCYELYKDEFDIYLNETFMFLLSFIRYLERPKPLKKEEKKEPPPEKIVWYSHPWKYIKNKILSLIKTQYGDLVIPVTGVISGLICGYLCALIINSFTDTITALISGIIAGLIAAGGIVLAASIIREKLFEEKPKSEKKAKPVEKTPMELLTDELMLHLFSSKKTIQTGLSFLKDRDFLAEYSPLSLTFKGRNFFNMFELDELPTREQVKAAFKKKWNGHPAWPALQTTYNASSKLFGDSGKLKSMGDEVFLSMARQYDFIRKIRLFINKHLGIWWTAKQKEFLNSEQGKFLYQQWIENVGGYRKGYEAESEEKAEFFKYMFERLEKKNRPEYKQTYQNVKMNLFGLKILRPNPYAYLYLSFPFTLIHLKERIEDYIHLSIISGEYDTLLRRFPPYAFMLNLFASPGDRTPIDGRIIDIPPISYRLDRKLVLALELEKTPARSNDRFISIKFDKDPEVLAEKKALIKEMTAVMENSLPQPAFPIMGNYKIDNEGNIYHVNKDGKKEIIPVFGPKRATFIQTKDELNLVKANYAAGPKSSLVISFNILDPTAVLVKGIDGERPVSINEIINVLQCHSLFGKMAELGSMDQIIDEVFNKASLESIPSDIRELIETLERLVEEDPSEEKAWEYLTPRLLLGNFKPLGQIIHHCLVGDGFEFLFSLWPLLTGKELKIDFDEGTYSENELEDDRLKTNKSQEKSTLPLLDFLKFELESLLKNIFSNHLDISAATKRFRSEPILAKLVVECCMHPGNDRDEEFGKRIENHLTNHYKIQYVFLTEHLAVEGDDPKTIELINSLEMSIEDRAKKDADAILSLTQKSRNRLLQREQNDRLLRFIDPNSVIIKAGDFEYSGKIIDEEKFLIMNQGLLKRLGKFQKTLDFKENKQVREISINRPYMERETNVILFKQQQERERLKAFLLTEFSGIKLKAFEKIKIGIESDKDDYLKHYAVLALIKAHQDGGVMEVERILRESPNLIMAINPELHHEQEVSEQKENIIHFVEKNPGKFNQLTASMLLDKPIDKIVASEIYNNFVNDLVRVLEMDKLAQNLRHFRPASDDASKRQDNKKRETGNSIDQSENTENKADEDYSAEDREDEGH